MFGPLFPINRNSLGLCSPVVGDPLDLANKLGFVQSRMRFVGAPAGMALFPVCSLSQDMSVKSRTGPKDNCLF